MSYMFLSREIAGTLLSACQSKGFSSKCTATFLFYFRCGIVSLWMAGQFLDPSNDTDVADIQDKAIEMQFTKHGEMFSAKNMAKLAKTVYKCDAKKVKGSHGILNDKKSLLRVIAGKLNCPLKCDFFHLKT